MSFWKNNQDLVDDDVMVLDSGLEIYVWVGVHSTEKEQEAGFSMAEVLSYLISLKDSFVNLLICEWMCRNTYAQSHPTELLIQLWFS